MAAKNVVRFFLATAPVAADIERLAEVQAGMRAFRLDQMIEHPAPVEHITLEAVADASAGSTSDSYEWSPPYPIELLKVQAACATAAGATGTAILQRKPSGDSYATITDAAIDVKTTAGKFVTGDIVDTTGLDLVGTEDTIKGVFASGSGGALAGGKVIVYYRRQRAG